MKEFETLKDQARADYIGGCFFFGLFLLLAIVGAVMGSSDSLLASGACLSIALTLFLFAQLLHIRAALEESNARHRAPEQPQPAPQHIVRKSKQWSEVVAQEDEVSKWAKENQDV